MNGLETTRCIREKFGYDMIIIGMSGSVLAEDVENFTSHGADGMIQKPVDIIQFLSVLETIMIERNL
jgi:CheY-like chemotaxis protein